MDGEDQPPADALSSQGCQQWYEIPLEASHRWKGLCREGLGLERA